MDKRRGLWLLLFGLASAAAARDTAALFGRVTDAQGNPRPQTTVVLEGGGAGLVSAVTDDFGQFSFIGLPRGDYRIRFEAGPRQWSLAEPLDLSSVSGLAVAVELTSRDGRDEARLAAARRNPTSLVSETDYGGGQLDRFPSGNTLGTVVENQDLSATTNRIDIGGIWTGTPALLSGRGSVSWTQTSYVLNGLDVTDPADGGRPLFSPDLWSLASCRLLNAGFPAGDISPGAALRMTTRRGGEEWRSSATVFWSGAGLSRSNVTPNLIAEGITENHMITGDLDGRFTLAGPLAGRRASLFTSFNALRLSRDIADFSGHDRVTLLSGTTGLTFRFGRADIDLVWTGQAVFQPLFGAARHVPAAATLDRRDLYNVGQALWTFRPGASQIWRAGLGFGLANIHERFPADSRGPHSHELFLGTPAGAAASAARDDRSRLSFFFNGESLVAPASGARHDLTYGVSVSRAATTARREVLGGLQLLFLDGRPLQVIKLPEVAEHSATSFRTGLYVQDTLTFRNFLTLTAGLELDATSGRQRLDAAASGEPGSVSWLNLSPRLGIILPFPGSESWFLQVFAGRYYFTLTHAWLAYGHPGAAGGLVYVWNDLNGNKTFEANEAGRLLRREGPLFGGIDPDLKRPRTDEFSIGVVRRSASGWVFSLTGYLRETRNLLTALNTGVPLSAYTPRDLFEAGDDLVPGTHDDLKFTLYDQDPATLGRDFYLLTNQTGEDRGSSYQGLDLVILRKTRRTVFYVSFTALQITGTTNPGSTEFENDEGVVGTLDANPNTLINARGRLRFDRGYTGRIGLATELGAGFRFAALVKYWDGQPFARKIIVSDLAQGPFYIMAHPRGVARYEFNMNVDLRLEKEIRVGRGAFRLLLDGFNIPNFHLATEENPWTGPAWPLRYATEIEPPLVIRLGMGYEF
jgi:Carboxypeptidase regulatory-like domain